MTPTYETVAVIAQQGGLLYFFIIFLAVLLYALRPKNGAEFDAAARIPFQED